MRLKILVVGGLNTDIIAHDVKKILQPGELTYGKKISIGPGGKPRNIAQMTATLTGIGVVAMVGRTAKDPFGLWKIPYDSLKKAGVDTKNITILDERAGQFPGIALIPVSKEGQNQIYVVPGVTNSFSPKDLDNTLNVFEIAAKNNGLLIITLEMPLRTVIHALKIANKTGLRVLLDPGGIEEGEDYSRLLSQKIFLIKPNVHEAKVLTGIEVKDEKSAGIAGKRLLEKGVENVFITVGSDGGYFVTNGKCSHIPVPKIPIGKGKDETGCGDQTMAVIAAKLIDKVSLGEALVSGMVGGAIQFGNSGIVPVTKKQLERGEKEAKKS